MFQKFNSPTNNMIFEATVPKPDLFRPKIRGGVSSSVLNINSTSFSSQQNSLIREECAWP